MPAMGQVTDLGLPSCQCFVNEIEAELVSGLLRQALDNIRLKHLPRPSDDPEESLDF